MHKYYVITIVQILVLLLVALVFKNNVAYTLAGMGLSIPAIVLIGFYRKESGLEKKILSVAATVLGLLSIISLLLFAIVMSGR